MDVSRRTFLALSAAAGVGFPLGALSRAAHAAVSPASKERPITVFTKHLQWMEYDALADTVAEAGFDGLDLTVRPGGHVTPDRVAQDLPRAVEAARKAGLVVPMMTTAITDPRDPNTEPILRAASEAGIRYYRMGYYRYQDERGVAGTLEAYRPLVQELARLNERYGIHGAYQNHAGTRVGGPVWDLWMLLEGLDPQWIGVQYDIRHAVVEGGTAWPLGLKLLSPYVRTMDIKDFRWEKTEGGWRPHTVPIGEGMVDFDAYFQQVRQLGIGGPISVHFEYAPLEGRNDLPTAERRKQAVTLMREDLQKVRAALSKAEL